MTGQAQISLRTGESIVAEGVSKSTGGRLWLIHIPAGRYPAGSGMRDEPEAWAVCSVFDGRRNSRSFTDKGAKMRGEESGLQSARALFNSWRDPDVTFYKREA